MPDEKLSRLRGDSGERKFGEAPILGKVPRTPGSAVRSSSGKIVRRKRRKKPSRVVLAWTCLIAFVSACVVAVVTTAYFSRHDPASGNPGAIAAGDDRGFSDSTSPATPHLQQGEAIALVKSALATRHAAHVGDRFILGEVNSPEEALRELALIRENEGAVTSMRWIGEKPYNGGYIGEAMVFMENGDRKGIRLAQLIACDDGKWRIDLDSYLRKVSPGWEEIIAGKSETSLVRIFLASDVYYNGIYSDESVWKAYALASPDIPDILYGYARRESPQHMALARILDTEDPIHRATLRIRKTPESGDRQFEIIRVLADNWVVGRKDFEGAF